MVYQERAYQQECESCIEAAMDEGKKLLAIVMATGTGKTIVFCKLAKKRFIDKGKKVLILAHREELLQQAMDKILALDPTMRVEIEQGTNHAEPEADVIIASVATLGRTDSNRIKKFHPEHFGLIIVDEAHHATASTYQNIFTYFGCNKKFGIKPDCPFLLGVTATPSRKDNVGLDTVFDHLVFKYDIKDGITEGYLADIEAYTIFTDQTVNVKMQAGDFAIGELADAVNTPVRNKVVVDSYRRIVGGQKALCFAVDVQHAHDLAEVFRSEGYTSEAISGETPTEERKSILERFANGDLQVVTNCMVLTEGYDAPAVMAILFARPTASPSLYVQMAGRGTRLFPGKTVIKFLDFVDNMRKHSIISASHLIGLEKPIMADGHRILSLEEKYEELLSHNPNADVSNIKIEDLDKRIEQVNIFSIAKTPEIIKQNSEFTWFDYLEGFRISLGEDPSTKDKFLGEIRMDMLGKFDVNFCRMVRRQDPLHKDGILVEKQIIFSAKAEDSLDAIRKGDTYIKTNMSDKMGLVSQGAKWRVEKPTEKQIQLLQKFGYSNAHELTKGEASNLISKVLSKKSGQ